MQTPEVAPPNPLRAFTEHPLSAFVLSVVLLTGCLGMTGRQDDTRTARMHRSAEWRDRKFQDPQPPWQNVKKTLEGLLFNPNIPNTQPTEPVAVVGSHGEALKTAPASGLRVTWFGHSSTLVEIDGTKILLDPFWSKRASPVQWVGPKRWYTPPIPLSDLPQVDAVLISHDHYDHLDYGVISAMKSWNTVFIVPLGIGETLGKWGIPKQRIHELDWWESTSLGGLTVTSTPSRHFSGRSLTRNKTLWSSWAIVGPRHRVWYSGDTGFHSGLSAIGERLGPFDATLIEVGQYSENWPDIHLGPEQGVWANQLVRGKTMIPVHWGLIQLAPHGWTEPVERAVAAGRCYGVEVLTPRPGESIEPTQHPKLGSWWPSIPWRSASTAPIVATKDGQASDRYALPPCRRRNSPT